MGVASPVLPALAYTRYPPRRGVGGKPGRRETTTSNSPHIATARTGEGALRGRSPRTREGRIGPTARNCSSQWSVVREGANSDAELMARWVGFRSDLKRGEVRPHFGMHPPGVVQVTRRRCWACGNYRDGWRPTRLTTIRPPRSSRRLPIRSRMAQPLIPVGTGPTAVVETCEKDSEENAP